MPVSLFRSAPARPLVAASILSADLARLGEELHSVLDGGADAIHVDVMDGHFVPNLSMGPAVCAAVRRAAPQAFIDVHLMVERPSMFLAPFHEAGADHCSFHVEAREDPLEVAKRCQALGMSAGVAVNPQTPIERLRGALDRVELVLVMSVHPGYSGQAFLPEVLEKARWVRREVGGRVRVEIDGGVSPKNARRCVDAGVDVLVSASALFGSTDRTATIAALRG